MISNMKAKEDVLMMRNGVNSIRMEGKETKKQLLFHYAYFSLVFPTI